MARDIIDRQKTSGRNEVEIKGDKFKVDAFEDKDWKVEIRDLNGKLIESGEDLEKNSKNLRADIILKVHPISWDTELTKGDVIYRLNDFEQPTEYQRCKNQAISWYIYDKIIPNLTEKSQTILYKKLAGVSCIISKHPNNVNGEIEVRIKNENITNIASQINDAKIFNLFIKFNPNDAVELDEFVTFSSPSSPKESFWTWRKVVGAFFIVALISGLLYFYRKKIWGWIKRENKTEKKEQVEIF